jgi:hypothetical protein
MCACASQATGVSVGRITIVSLASGSVIVTIQIAPGTLSDSSVLITPAQAVAILYTQIATPGSVFRNLLPTLDTTYLPVALVLCADGTTLVGNLGLCPTAPPPPPPPPAQAPIGAIVGGVIGGLVALALIIFGIKKCAERKGLTLPGGGAWSRAGGRSMEMTSIKKNPLFRG